MKAVFFTVVFAWMVAMAFGHSWLDCADWRFNDPNRPGYLDTDGKCFGYPRRYPPTARVYGSFDGFRWYRHYVQDPNWKTSTDKTSNGQRPCSFNNNEGSYEVRGNPVEANYAPNRDFDGNLMGPQVVTQSGARLCWRWPAKNHASHVNDASNVSIYWARTPGTPDPARQDALFSSYVTGLRYRNCPAPGVPGPTDQSGPGSDRMPCGGCFNVPARDPGVYLVQWRWMLNPGEWYTSCADIKITANAPTPVPPGPTPSPTPTPSPNPNIEISALMTISLPKPISTFDISGFVASLAAALDIPSTAFSQVLVNLDSSSDNPPLTIIQFIITNADGTNPIEKARLLKQMAESGDARLASNEDLAGLQVLSLDETGNLNGASSVFFSVSLLVLAILSLLL